MSKSKRSGRGTKARSRRRAREADEQFGPDRSEVVYTFDDGWTIRRLTCLSDVNREGAQMLSCLRAGLEDDDPFPLESILSLRDPQNAPHLTIRHVAEYGTVAYGKAETVPKAEYRPYIVEWVASLPEGNELYDAAAGPSESRRDDPFYLLRGFMMTVSEAHDEAFIDYMERAGRHSDAAFLRSGAADAHPTYLSELLAECSALSEAARER